MRDDDEDGWKSEERGFILAELIVCSMRVCPSSSSALSDSSAANCACNPGICVDIGNSTGNNNIMRGLGC